MRLCVFLMTPLTRENTESYESGWLTRPVRTNQTLVKCQSVLSSMWIFSGSSFDLRKRSNPRTNVALRHKISEMLISCWCDWAPGRKRNSEIKHETWSNVLQYRCPPLVSDRVQVTPPGCWPCRGDLSDCWTWSLNSLKLSWRRWSTQWPWRLTWPGGGTSGPTGTAASSKVMDVAAGRPTVSGLGLMGLWISLINFQNWNVIASFVSLIF